MYVYTYVRMVYTYYDVFFFKKKFPYGEVWLPYIRISNRKSVEIRTNPYGWRLRQRQLWISSLSLLRIPLPMPTQLLLLSLSFFLSTERIDASYFKAPLTTSKSRQTTSEAVWALFVRCCYADNAYSTFLSLSNVRKKLLQAEGV